MPPRRRRAPVVPQMNLTPLIDVVMQLIIFFMLVSHLASEEMVPMWVPRLDAAQTQAMEKSQRIVVSVAPESFSPQAREADPLLFPGVPRGVQVGRQWFEAGDLDGITAAVEAARAAHPHAQVILRADAALHYQAVQPIMSALARAGIQQLSIAADLPHPSHAQDQE